MGLGKDPKGYYERLGVSPSASADDIKKAYRRLAKELHPDLNRNAGAKTRFQSINEAYGVLNDPDLRAKYDALQYAEPQRHESKLDPICCSRCGKVTAQPRSTVFYRVVSVVLLTTRTPVQGIFCSACAKKVAFRASLVSAAAGWWGFPWGPIWTIGSIFRNAFGGSYSKDIDEKLLWYNALAFLQMGKLAISYALAQQARTAGDAEMAINAVRLMDHLRALGVPAASPILKNPWNLRPAVVSAHLALLLAVPGAVALAAYSDDAKHSVSRSFVQPDLQIPRPAYFPSPSRPAQAPSTQSVNSSAHVPTCPFPPMNGTVLVGSNFVGVKGHSIQIQNGSGGNAIIKVRNADSGRVIVSFYVQRGQSASFDSLLDGSYRIQYALGNELQVDCRSFVNPNTVQEFPGVKYFATETTSTQIIREVLTYTLYSVPNGNVRPERIDLASFNAD
jgi:DnaJ domain